MKRSQQLIKQTKSRKILNRFYEDEVGDPSYITRYIYEKAFEPIENLEDRQYSYQQVVDRFSEAWENTCLSVWYICQDSDKEEPVYWTC
jgi:hypothetical protein